LKDYKQDGRGEKVSTSMYSLQQYTVKKKERLDDSRIEETVAKRRREEGYGFVMCEKKVK